MTGVELIGLAIAAVGTATAVYGAVEASEASQDAEQARKKQMNLDAARRRREAVRQSIVAKGLAVNNAAASGASEGTALQGGLAQISGNAAESVSNTNQNVAIGNAIYDANGRRAGAEAIAGVGQGMQSVGNTVLANSKTIKKTAQGYSGLFDAS